MHSQKTMQPYIRSDRKNRARKKSAVEEVPRNRPEKNKRDEPFEQLKSTESLKRQGPENKPENRTKYIKTVLEIAKNGTPKDKKAKQRARAEISKLTRESRKNNRTGPSCKLARRQPLKTRAGRKMDQEKQRESRTQKRERSPT